MNNLKRNGRYLSLSIIGIVILWFLYTFSYLALKQYHILYAGYLSFIGEVGLDIVAAVLAFYLWKKTTGPEKIVFALFSISFLLAAITDISYNINTNILGITNFTNIIDSTFDIPFLGFLIFQLLAWIVIFLKIETTQNKGILFSSIFTIAILVLIIFGIFLFHTLWKAQNTHLVETYIAIDTVLQLLTLIFIVPCLIIVPNNQIRQVAVGYIIIMLADLIVHFEVLTRILKESSLLETLWILGLLFIVFGLYGMIKNPLEFNQVSKQF